MHLFDQQTKIKMMKKYFVGAGLGLMLLTTACTKDFE